MTEPRYDDGLLEPIEGGSQAEPWALGEPPPPGGRTEIGRIPAAGPLPAVPGQPPVTTAVPVPAGGVGQSLPGVQLAQRARRRGDTFGWPANAAPGKPEGEVDTRPRSSGNP